MGQSIMLLRYSIASALLFIMASTGQASTISIPSYDVSTTGIDSNPFQVSVIQDASRALTIDEIASGRIEGTLTSSRFYLKSTDVNYWFVFTLENTSSQSVNRVIRFDEPFTEHASLYYRQGESWHELSAGLAVPIKERRVYNRNPVFPVRLDPGETKTVYLKLQSNYGRLTIGLYCEKPEIFLNWELLQTACYLFYFGAASALIIYNLFLFFALNERLYLYYVLHGLSYIVWVFLYSGFDLYLGIGKNLHYGLNPVTNFVLIFLILFTRRLLQTEVNFPNIDKILIGIAIAALLLGIASFSDIYYYQYLTFLGLSAYLFFMFLGVYAVLKRVTLSGYYLLSMVLYFSGIILLALLLMDLVNYSLFARYLYMPGSLAELTIFSLALAYRVKLLQNQNTAFQQQLIETERKAKARLEAQVAERTEELRQANVKLERMAMKDGLTGLANRRFLDERLRYEWQRLKREQGVLAVILCDIDYFKRFNDYYGHQGGDECLIKVAQAIQSSLQRPGDLCGRYGGEEFLILLPNTDIQGAAITAERIRSAVEALRIKHLESDIAAYVTLSLGVATASPHEGRSAEHLVSVADEALYRAKDQGRNQVVLMSPRPKVEKFPPSHGSATATVSRGGGASYS
ncbi:diguanylate cyclase domain-containing protein [Allochromatium palmeri]|uniref:diguanylate cyclase n=1 Tax=Allochromatium palmeri TaxID=231048 RepID=A0A6N8E808_9GAMM|nr:diguanylate cyclase [Allochromatium palmeri]MTW19711.1 diguanylate cyclase [Allochromatium palmeri]